MHPVHSLLRTAGVALLIGGTIGLVFGDSLLRVPDDGPSQLGEQRRPRASDENRLEPLPKATSNLSQLLPHPSADGQQPAPHAHAIVSGCVVGPFCPAAQILLVDEQLGGVLASGNVDRLGRFLLETVALDRWARVRYVGGETSAVLSPRILTAPGKQSVTVPTRWQRCLAIRVLGVSGNVIKSGSSESPTLRTFVYKAHPRESFRGIDLHPAPPTKLDGDLLCFRGLDHDLVSLIVWNHLGTYGELKAVPTTLQPRSVTGTLRLLAGGCLSLQCLPDDQGARIGVLDAKYGDVSNLQRIETMVDAGARARLATVRGKSVTIENLWPLEYRVCVFSSHGLLLVERTVTIYPGAISRAVISGCMEAGWLEILLPERSSPTRLTLVDEVRGRIDRFGIPPRKRCVRMRVREGRHTLIGPGFRQSFVMRRRGLCQLSLAP